MEYWSEVMNRLDLHAKGAWVVYSTGALLLLLALLLKRKLTWREYYVTFGIISTAAWLGNIVLFFQLDLLDSGDPSIGGIADIIVFTFAPSSISLLFLNFYKPNIKWAMSIGFTLLAVALEYWLVTVGFFTQKGWQVWYSIPLYFLFFFFFLPWHLRYVRGKGEVVVSYTSSSFRRK
ncbi:hypothetical protein [Paenibacillus mesotrionivorans]|uniref:Uncharacterized protein n=1 Tax=Paenibacillus mesotrionivorans TaxID=3160968 RepID=A0ACC7NWZ6_9BACL